MKVTVRQYDGSTQKFDLGRNDNLVLSDSNGAAFEIRLKRNKIDIEFHALFATLDRDAQRATAKRYLAANAGAAG